MPSVSFSHFFDTPADAEGRYGAFGSRYVPDELSNLLMRKTCAASAQCFPHAPAWR